MKHFRRLARWPLTPILILGLLNVLLYSPSDGCGLQWWVAIPPAITFLAGMLTANRLLWFAALCMSMPILMLASGQHGTLVGFLWTGFWNPTVWSYFIQNFLPIYFCYLFVVVCGALFKKAATSLWTRWPLLGTPD